MTYNYVCSPAVGGQPSTSTTAAPTGGWWTGAVALLLLVFNASAQAQQRPAALFFREDVAAQAAAAGTPLRAALRHARPLTLDVVTMQAALATAPLEGPAGAAALTLALPLPDGSSARFAVVEAPIMEPALAAQFPTIRTYRGVGLDDPTATIRLDFTPLGFHAQVLATGKSPVYIDPISLHDTRHYLAFYRSDMDRSAVGNRAPCGVTAPAVAAAPGARRSGNTGGGPALVTTGSVLRTYRLAVAATGEYTATKGGTVAGGQAGIVTTMNRVDGVYATELAIRMVLVANNSSLVYTNGTTDPYTNNDGVAMLTENQNNVTAVIGTANYDIGHVFSTGGGGVAGLGVVCISNEKAMGVTGSPSPVGDAFDIDYVAHEMGHQFGASHTFNSGGTTNCSDSPTVGTRNAATAYEPGSGSTIMAYAGICAPDNIQNNSDPYFHVASYEEIEAYVSTAGCGTTAATSNALPVVAALPASGKVLPVSTPFKLTASGTDADGDPLTYCWEEYDLGPSGAPIAPQVNGQANPIFRSFLPTASPTRYFPRLSDLVNNTSNIGERLPTVNRALKFRVTLRDQHNSGGSVGLVGGINSSTVVSLSATAAAGPFVVTAPNTAVSYAGNSTQTVTWNVAGTNANGVNCATVNILLSTDGGFTYPTTLLAGTPNDGTASVTIPNTPTTTARIQVEAADNYFFDISNTNFTITAGAAVCNAPTGVTVTSITSSSATVSYTASASATNYTVTTTPASTTQTVSGTTANLTGLTAGTNYTVNVVSNCAGGATSAAAPASFTTGAAPVVSSVTTPLNTTYGIGQTIPVTVHFSQAVTVTGAPTLALTIGSTVRQAAFAAAGSSGADVVFNYVVQAGDLDTNGIAIGSISLNGGTIQNAAGTNANLTLNNVANTSTVLVDGVRPTVTSINRLTPATALTNGSGVTFRVVFSESVTGVSTADFSLTTTGTASGSVASVSGSGTTYDVVVNTLSGDGTLRLDLNASGTGIADAAGNASNTGFTSGQSYTLDHTAPTTSIDSGPAVVTTSTSATFTFSGTDANGVARFEGSLDGAAFVTVTSPTTFTGLGIGQHTFQVRAIDAAGNVDPSPASYTWTVATPAPTISSLNPNNGPVGTGVTISGTNFTGATAVSFNGTPAAFTFNSPSSISATVPAGASTGPVTVTTPGGTSNGMTFTVTTPACNPPTNAAVSNTTQTTATVSYTASGTATSYTITTTPASTTQTVSGTTANLSGLTAGTAYTVNVVSNCAGGTTSAAATANFTTTAPPCNAPTAPAPANVTVSTAQVTFTPSASAANYTVTTSPTTTTQTVSGSPVSFSSLTANTTYTVSIVSNCAGGATSAAATTSFTTTPADLVVSSFFYLTAPATYHNVTVTGTGILILGSTLTVTGTLLVQSSGTFQSNCYTVVGPGNFTLAAGATISVCSVNGLSLSGTTGDVQVSGNRSFSPDASYSYVGRTAQATGSGLPATVRNLTDSASTLSLSQPVAVRQVLTLNAGNLLLGSFNLTLASDATGTGMVVNAGSGQVLNNGTGLAIVQRFITPSTAYTGPGYRHYSSPVASTPVSDLAVPGIFTPLVDPAYNALPTPNLPASQFPNVFGYDQNRLTAAFPSFDTGWFSPNATTDPLVVTKGYTVNLAPAATVDLRGLLNNGSLNTGPLGRAPFANGGWQFLGNPYPAPLDWSQVTSTPGNLPTGLVNAIYVFEPTSQYGGFYRAFVNNMGTGGFAGILPSMQGFFARTTQAVPAGFTFRNAFRLTTYANPAFHRNAADSRPTLRLTLAATAAPALADETVLYLEAGATATGTDARYDAAKLPSSAAPLSVASQMSGPANEALAINGLPLVSAAGPATRVPLLVSATAPGAYQLHVAGLTGFDASQAVLLLDHATNATIDLRQQPSYGFTLAQTGPTTGRFEVLLGRPGSVAATAAAAETTFSVWPNPATSRTALHLELAMPAVTATATLHDVLGRAVATRTFSGRTAELPTTGLATGTYLLTVTVPGQVPTTRRVVVE